MAKNRVSTEQDKEMGKDLKETYTKSGPDNEDDGKLAICIKVKYIVRLFLETYK